ncbi:hypothetical protein SBA2_910009 [Acidobacteriia bacterium SbA2]|nr:hypothetical protein SBA2_910009 [Acidobacteriia bacterium SbA2]
MTNRQFLTKLEVHTHAVAYAAFSPDSQRIVIAIEDKTARLWRVAIRADVFHLAHGLTRLGGYWLTGGSGFSFLVERGPGDGTYDEFDDHAERGVEHQARAVEAGHRIHHVRQQASKGPCNQAGIDRGPHTSAEARSDGGVNPDEQDPANAVGQEQAEEESSGEGVRPVERLYGVFPQLAHQNPVQKPIDKTRDDPANDPAKDHAAVIDLAHFVPPWGCDCGSIRLPQSETQLFCKSAAGVLFKQVFEFWGACEYFNRESPDDGS